MNTTPVVSFVAACSGSGKTTLITKLLEELSARGLRIAVIKHGEHLNLPPEGKDTSQYLASGAEISLISTPQGWLMSSLSQKEPALEELLQSLEPLKLDYIFVEGYKKGSQPRIEIHRRDLETELACSRQDLIAVVTDEKLDLDLPQFVPDDIQGILDFIIKFGKEEDSLMEEKDLTHLDDKGRARMVDVSEKEETHRAAVARGWVEMAPETLRTIATGGIKKGDVLAVAQVAGVMAAKKTSDIVPMCHPLLLTGVNLDFRFDYQRNRVEIEATVKTYGQTGVEIEALTAVSVAGLTIYDMCKAIDRGMTVGDIRLVEKSGGRSGRYLRSGEAQWQK